jgi:hypothetical protein
MKTEDQETFLTYYLTKDDETAAKFKKARADVPPYEPTQGDEVCAKR